MNYDKANVLRKVLEYAVRLPQYQRDYFSGGTEETHCNILARDVLDRRAKIKWNPGEKDYGDIGGLLAEYDYDIRSMNPGHSLQDCIINTYIPIAYEHVLAASKETVMDIGERARGNCELNDKPGTPIELTPQQAQDAANDGIPIWITGYKWNRDKTKMVYRHEAIVFPTMLPYNEEFGVKVAQAGWYNGIFWISDFQAWGDWWRDPEIKYFQFPEYKEG